MLKQSQRSVTPEGNARLNFDREQIGMACWLHQSQVIQKAQFIAVAVRGRGGEVVASKFQNTSIDGRKLRDDACKLFLLGAEGEETATTSRRVRTSARRCGEGFPALSMDIDRNLPPRRPWFDLRITPPGAGESGDESEESLEACAKNVGSRKSAAGMQ